MKILLKSTKRACCKKQHALSCSHPHLVVLSFRMGAAAGEPFPRPRERMKLYAYRGLTLGESESPSRHRSGNLPRSRHNRRSCRSLTCGVCGCKCPCPQWQRTPLQSQWTKEWLGSRSPPPFYKQMNFKGLLSFQRPAPH